MTRADALELGHAHFGRQAWTDAYAQLSTADVAKPLEPADLERLAVAAQLSGREDARAPVRERTHHELLRRGDTEQAALCAFWLGMSLPQRGEAARSGGWLGRARRLVDEGRLDCAVQGYLLVPEGLQTLYSGDPATANAAFTQATKVGDRFGDLNLITLGRLGQGLSLIALGEIREGVALLDEAMVAVTSGELAPLVVYCAVISERQESRRRAGRVAV